MTDELATRRRHRVARNLHEAIKGSLAMASRGLDALEKLRLEEIAPDVIEEEIVIPIRDWTVEAIFQLQTGTNEEYDNLDSIIEQTIYQTIAALEGE